MLSRSESLAQDISYLLSLKPSSEWTTDPRDTYQSTKDHSLPTAPFPVPPFLSPLFTSPPPAITAFTTRLTTVSSSRPALLLAHAYVRYLGDLSGGQLVRSKIRRVYSLDPADAETPSSSQAGTQFYEFDIFDSADRSVDGGVKQPTMYERKQRMTDIKEWFRGVLDSGTADGKEELKREPSSNFASSRPLILFPCRCTRRRSHRVLPPLHPHLLRAPSDSRRSIR